VTTSRARTFDPYTGVEVHASPYREYDVLIFTGLGLMGRELINIRSSDIVVVVGGRSGTLVSSPSPTKRASSSAC
jgi:hypothetical protein